MSKLLTYLFLLCLTLMQTGCVLDESFDNSSTGPSRTILFYMGGDNNLSGELSEKLNAIQQFAAGSQRVQRGEVKLLIYQDGPSGSKLYRAVFGQYEPLLVGEYGREDSASAQVLARMLQDCILIAPSDSYGMVVFSHASGWLPAGMLTAPRGRRSRSIVIDNGAEMDIKDFAAAIPPQTFDYVIFEACYMACVEVAYELRDKVQYVLASPTEMLSPGFTNIYSQLLTKLCCPLVDTPTSLSNAAKVYFDHYDSKKGLNRSATVSVVRTSELEPLAQLYHRLTPQLATANPQAVQHFDRNTAGDHLFFDLEHCVARYAPQASAELSVLLSKSVIFHAATPEFLLSENGFRIEACCGLSIYIPQEQFPKLNTEYRKLQWSKTDE